mmetsp:Transcript_23338/g.51291  ORF Transcript_23338/g.51291 Transcript_23338/m.51291 type:complete len:549 (-) Transcript_23338:270-1916(-)|eukprot:CAMPEP_0206452246 /NCGR_PEP_ID=MMETSP0324_2-20121206/19837_1 /ASSEMBLY_ACC=CAM_ASM_000836 /TAXON_ID=2866 /ORGANISM="Crypthecodinium cohnii, Strain Seligo" /LENGTH=548 /DNA_ID=CAMNT_0053922311 /DNA_START=76 /DNA_END=1722 /DNA_ORIENTATION=+
MAKRFVNETSTIVTEAVDGLLCSSPNLTRLDAFPDIKVVVRSDWDKDCGKVSVICGGGSGHEPAYAGFVGAGMLTAAVCGNVFASPSQDAVLAAIVATTGKAGCVLICMNYTGDRFCFGVAAARAKNEYGLDVKFVVVSDDVAIPDAKQPRGLGGTLFVVKIAGAAAEAKESLEVVEKEAVAAASSVKSLGVSFSSCTKPGEKPAEERMAENEMEVGLGIHGEPGYKRMQIGSADEVAKLMAESILPHVDQKAELVLLITNLGAVPPLETSVMANSMLKHIKAKFLVGPGSLITSLDMNGIQACLLQLSGNMEDRLLAPTPVRQWPGAVKPNMPKLLPLPLNPEPEKEQNPVRDESIDTKIKKVCEALIQAEKELNDLDLKVGDGDCGSTVRQGAEMVLAVLPQVSSSNPKKMLAAIGRQLDKLGGSSGVLLSIMFTTMAGCVTPEDKWTVESMGPAFFEGVTTIMNVGGAQPGMRTMIDVFHPVAEAVKKGTAEADLAKLAQDKADATANIKSTNFGRAMYLNEESLSGFKDPGCVAAAIAIAALTS